MLFPGQSPSNALLLQETDNKAKDTPNIVRGSVKNADLKESAFSFPPYIRQIIEPCAWSRPPRFLVQAGDAVVNERLRKAFCAATRRPLVLLRSFTIPTPASFGESRESLEAYRAELKRAGYRFGQYPQSGLVTLHLHSYIATTKLKAIVGTTEPTQRLVSGKFK